MSDADGMLEFGTIVIVGGGCYGSQYLDLLRRARTAGRVRFERLLVVDQSPNCQVATALAAGARQDDGVEFIQMDWRAFFGDWLARAVEKPALHARDTIVPSPLMPHLLFEWLLERARVRAGRALPVVMPAEVPAVPWQKEGGDGTRYVSFATWMCPINCIEPAKCPHTKGPRDWSMHDALPAASGTVTALLRVTHRTFGVGMIDVADVVTAHDLVTREVSSGHVVRVATASHCHGALAQIGG
jgi:hypothetical protein